MNDFIQTFKLNLLIMRIIESRRLCRSKLTFFTDVLIPWIPWFEGREECQKIL